MRGFSRLVSRGGQARALESTGGPFPHRLPVDQARPGDAHRLEPRRPHGGRADRHGDHRSLPQERGRRVRPRTITTGERIVAWQRALHYGIGLGGGYKFLVFVSGVIIPVFAVTAVPMWWIKRRNRRAGERAKAAIQAGAAARAQTRLVSENRSGALDGSCGKTVARTNASLCRSPSVPERGHKEEISDEAPHFCLHTRCGRSRAVRRLLS